MSACVLLNFLKSLRESDKMRGNDLTLSLPNPSKNQYLSAKHVSRTPEYYGYMGST